MRWAAPRSSSISPARKEVLHAFASHAKAEAVFGRRDAVQLDDGLGRMAEWVRQRGPQRGVAFSGIEITRNLPPSWARLTGVQD